MPFLKWSSSFLLLKSLICHISAINCERMVAMAAPRIPHLKTRMKSASSITFITTVKMVAYIACLGLLAARSRAFIPKYMWLTTLPSRMMTIYSWA